jgi:pimeloyl-ACP methyl ester carboxylesterase
MRRTVRRSTRGRAPRRAPADARTRLAALAAHYADADRRGEVYPAPPMPAVRERARGPRLGAAHVVDLAYESAHAPTYPGYDAEYFRYEENRTARARWFRGGGPRPVILCLHGWGGGAFWLEERAFPVAYLLRIGLDVVLFQLPMHGDRTPRQAARSGALFPGPHVVRTNEAFVQAIGDLRALATWLRARGAPAVGACGMSLGGYTTALWAGLDPELAFAIPIIPAVSMADLFWRHGRGDPTRQSAERVGVDRDALADAFGVHEPLRRAPKLPRDRLLIVAGRGDRITPPDHAEALWAHWGEPAIHWFAGGHLAQIGRGDGFRAIRRHLAGCEIGVRRSRR